jgi:hypothetical protein
MRLDSPPKVDRSHLKALRDLMLKKGLDPEKHGRGQQLPRVFQKDILCSIKEGYYKGFHGDDRIPEDLGQPIHSVVQGLQSLLNHAGQKSPPIERSEDISDVPDGWTALSLVGEINRSAQERQRMIQLDKSRIQSEAEMRGAITLEWLWAILVKRAGIHTLGVQGQPRLRKEDVLDRVLEGLLHRLTRMPRKEGGVRLHSGDILKALELFLEQEVSPLQIDEAEEELCRIFHEWNRWMEAQGQSSRFAPGIGSPFHPNYDPPRENGGRHVFDTIRDRDLYVGIRWMESSLVWIKEGCSEAQIQRLEQSYRFTGELQHRILERAVRRQTGWEEGKRAAFGTSQQGKGGQVE